jgi:CBS domain-containing protein
MSPLGDREWADPREDVVLVLERMLNTGAGRLPVIESGRLVGILSRRDIMDFLHVRTDLGSPAT